MKSLFQTMGFSSPILAILACGTAAAQCANDWIKTDGFPGIETFQNAYAVAAWDPDGNGPLAERLVVGGTFQYIADRAVDTLGAFNPEAGIWEDIGGGVEFLKKTEGGQVLDTAYVDVLSSFQNKLIVGGFFSEAGGVAVSNLASWDGVAWSSLDGGLDGFAQAMVVYNGELIVAGTFPTAGGVTVNNVARWDGAAWHPLGSPEGTNNIVRDVAVYEGELIAVGNFLTAGGVAVNRIARWNGSMWQPLGSGLDAPGTSLTVIGRDLYVGGNFAAAGGVPGARAVARWDGSAWHQVTDAGFVSVGDLITYEGDVVASGPFIINAEGGQARHIARLDSASQTWHSMQGGFNNGGNAEDMAVYNGELIAAGLMNKAGNRTLRGVARWNGETWSAIAPGFDITPTHFATYRGELIAGGGFGSAGDAEARGVARWDGKEWNALESGVGLNVVGVIDDLEVHNDELIVSGHFSHAGGVAAANIAAWDGETETWHDLDGGISGGCEIPRVHTMAVYDGDLIAGGCFSQAGGVSVFNIARWDGEQWHAMGAGVGVPRSMTVYEGELYVSVSTGLDGMQRWDGAQWHAVPGGFNGFSMTVFDDMMISGFLNPMAYDGATWTQLPNWSWDPNGAAVGNFGYTVFEDSLIVAGQFENAAGIAEADGLVRFDGTAWHSFAGANGNVDSITSGVWVHNGELITNGRVAHPDGSVSNWRRFGSACLPGDMNCDGVLSVSDIGAFVMALTNPAGYAISFPNCNILNGDLNGDGAVTVGDIGAFVAALTR